MKGWEVKKVLRATAAVAAAAAARGRRRGKRWRWGVRMGAQRGELC